MAHLVKKYKRYILILISLFLLFDLQQTLRLNHKYNDAINYDMERLRNCEIMGDIYIFADRLKMFEPYMVAAVEYNNVYYDELHETIQISLIIRENKFGHIEYSIGFSDDDDWRFGGAFIIDKDLNVVSFEAGENEPAVLEIYEQSGEEIKEMLGLANERWGLKFPTGT